MDRDRLVGVVAVVALVVALVLFVSENAQTVRLDLMVGTVETRLGWAVLISAAAGFIVGSVFKR